MAFKTKTWMAAACGLAVGALLPAAIAPVDAAGPYDGTYRGTVKLVRSTITPQGKADCGSTTAAGRQTTRRVADNKVTINYGGSDITFNVGADGTISGTSTYGRNQLTATGRITASAMVMDYGTQYCGFHFEGSR